MSSDGAGVLVFSLVLVFWLYRRLRSSCAGHGHRLDPEAGDLIPHGRGLRKLRRPLPGRGKSGGARVIYYHINDENLIYLVFAYAKNRQENLTKDQLKQLGKLLT